MMLGENAIRFFDLDRDALAVIASKIGPTVEDVAGSPDPVDDELLAIFDTRGGYLKPAEGDLRIPDITPMLERDLATFSSHV